jgi:hypothetical protein
MHPDMRRACAGLVGAALALLSVLAVSAHVVTQFGTYTVAIGWLHEPTYAGEDNAVQVLVKDAGGNAFNDLNAGDLKVQVIEGSKTSDPMILNPSFDPDTGLGTPGEYDASIIPTVPGDYTFHLTGSIHGTPVDKSLTSGPMTFNTVKEPSAVQFPVHVPSAADLSTALTRTGARVDTAQSATNSASGTTTAALIIAIVGAVLAVGLGGTGLFIAARRRG